MTGRQHAAQLAIALRDLLVAVEEVVAAHDANNPGKKRCLCRQCVSVQQARTAIAKAKKEKS